MGETVMTKVSLASLRGMLFALVAGALGFTAITMVKLHQELTATHATEQSRPAWIASRLEFELIRFNEALSDYLAGRATGDEVRLRFDILWSRLVVIEQGRTEQALDDIGVAVDVLAEVKRSLIASEQLILGLEALSISKVNRIADAFGNLAAPVRNLTLESLRATSDEATSHRARLLASANTVAVLSMGTVLASVILSLLFFRERSREREVSEERLRLLEEGQAANIAKSQFVSMINHEIRTPLTSIKGGISLLAGGAGGAIEPAGQRLLDIAKTNCNKLGHLIDDLLDFDKLAEGEFKVDMQTADLSRLVREAAMSNTAYASSRGVTVSAREVDGGIMAEVDPRRIDQVLNNLISNAAKFSHEGGEVVVGLVCESSKAVITVRDQGLGIPPEKQSQIFERFQQVDCSDHRSRGGTGLGLPIAKGLVEAMGGEVRLKSAVGQGTTFYVSFPACPAETVRSDAAAASFCAA